MSTKAKIFIAFIILVGSISISTGISSWTFANLPRFLGYLVIALAASTLKVRLPGTTGTMSVSFLFVLVAILELSLTETLLIGCSANLVQSLWRPKVKPKLVQVTFNICAMAIAVTSGNQVFQYQVPWLGENPALMLALAATAFFLANTTPVAIVVALIERKSIRQVWQDSYFWSLPYYLLGAILAVLFSVTNQNLGWQTSLLILPVIYFIFRSYRLYLERLEGETKHAQEMADLHLRTIEALALAIDAKDAVTHDHLQRVQVYALEIGKELGLGSVELNALQAAALLHDIGKLAVPEHIISKPGKLTPEEFEKMKIHPAVGAEILERVQFPYPVVPIVRAHHEKWDGNGYPYGLKAEEIPIGARILSAVDCLDSLASDRQYRRALPLDKAMEVVVSEAGRSFDPLVVGVLHRRCAELEQLARSQPGRNTKLSLDLEIDRGGAPATGFETDRSESSQTHPPESIDFLSSIAAARQEAQTLFELTHELGNSLSLRETLSVLASRIEKMIEYHCIAIYLLHRGRLVSEFVSGEDAHLFSSIEIPVGQGLSGWVAENREPMLNGNPSVESSHVNPALKNTHLQSGLAIPLQGVDGVVGVLALYHREKDAFGRDDLRILNAISSKVALAIENALRFKQVETSATIDGLTGLPNARSLFLHLDGELARCRRLNQPLAVLVCDLDGFKKVNDRHGHLEGNRVLQLVAQGLKETCRQYDYAARMGGDEFVLVLPGAKSKGVESIIQRLEHMAVEAGIRICGEQLLSLSVGQASYPADGTDAEQLLGEADRRMYKVKGEHYREKVILER